MEIFLVFTTITQKRKKRNNILRKFYSYFKKKFTKGVVKNKNQC